MSAQPTTLTVDLPTTNTDGSAVAAGELVDIDVGYGPTSAAGAAAFAYPNIVEKVLTAVDPSGAATVAIPWSSVTSAALPVGVTYMAARMKTNNGVVSAWSTEVAWTVPAPVPNPPGFSVA